MRKEALAVYLLETKFTARIVDYDGAWTIRLTENLFDLTVSAINIGALRTDMKSWFYTWITNIRFECKHCLETTSYPRPPLNIANGIRVRRPELEEPHEVPADLAS